MRSGDLVLISDKQMMFGNSTLLDAIGIVVAEHEVPSWYYVFVKGQIIHVFCWDMKLLQGIDEVLG